MYGMQEEECRYLWLQVRRAQVGFFTNESVDRLKARIHEFVTAVTERSDRFCRIR